MTQSVELLLDPAAEDVVLAQWDALAAAGLPTERRPNAHGSHRPHVTLFAADQLRPDAEPALAELMTGLDLALQIGSLLIFGPRRDKSVVVRQVVPTAELLELQRAVALAGADDPGEHFAPGCWVPHVTLAHKVPNEQLGEVVAVLGEQRTPTRITACRRWDSDRRQTWLLS